MKRNRLMYALPLAGLLAAGVFARTALADDTGRDPGYGSQGAMSPSSSQEDNMKAPQHGMDRSSSTGNAMSDAAITTKVKSALLAERGLPSSQIKVQTNDGVVQLSGFLNSQAEIDRAVQVAGQIKDVKSVENNLQTK